LDDKEEARSDGGRRFQSEGPATEKVHYKSLLIIVLQRFSTRVSYLVTTPTGIARR